jgi:6-methylsalicylate decarboxylase
MNLRSIDLHHHFFPSSLDKAKRNIEMGWRTPDGNLPWNPAISLAGMDVLGIETAILSLPPNPFGTISSENRSVARAHNHFAAQICQEHPGRFGFFAGLPFLNDVDGEI